MNIEDRLRNAIQSRTSSVEPSPDALHRIEEKIMATPEETRTRWLIGAGAAAAAAAIVVGIFALTGDDDDPVDTVGTTTTVEDTTTTTEPTTTTEGSTTTVTFAPTVDPSVPIFPDPSTSRRFEDPRAAVEAFATEMVGLTSPVVGDFQAGDSRSGEVEVRASQQLAPNIVLVRQLEDDTWFVIGASTDSIRPEAPEQGATITSPAALEGMAYAFEGTVGVRLYADGTQEPVAETFVTGRGDGVLGDYEGELTFTGVTAGTHGVILYTSEGGEDGAPIYFAATRVTFG